MGSPRAKAAVRDYFDADATAYEEAYDRGREDTRSTILLERRRLVLQLLGAQPGRVLDVGAGPGVFTPFLVQHCERCWVLDLSFNMVLAARHRFCQRQEAARACFMAGDIERLPFVDRSFDATLCVGVLQYLETSDGALRELARVTKPGGRIILTFPNGHSPLNVLHRLEIAGVRTGLAMLRWFRIPISPTSSRLTFRSDIPNRWFTAKELQARSDSAGLYVESLVYHVLQFPFSIPGLGSPLRAWDRCVGTWSGSGYSGPLGREGIMSLRRHA